MAKLTRIAVTATVAIALSACSTTGRHARVNPANVTVHNKNRESCPLSFSYKNDLAQAIDLDCYTFDPETPISQDPANSSKQTDNKTAYYLASTNKDSRNRLQSILITQANLVCELEKGRIYANRATLDSALDFASAGLSIAGTIVSGELAKSILSGAAGLSTATRSNFNANVYQNQIVPAITKVMDAERGRIAIELQSRSKQDIESYNVDEMVRVVNEYHQGCSFQKGIQLLLDAALNKEGVDSIIRNINLQAAQQQIEQQMASSKNREASGLVDSSEAAETRKQLEIKLREILLQKAENLQKSGSTTPAAAEPATTPTTPEPVT